MSCVGVRSIGAETLLWVCTKERSAAVTSWVQSQLGLLDSADDRLEAQLARHTASKAKEQEKENIMDRQFATLNTRVWVRIPATATNAEALVPGVIVDATYHERITQPRGKDLNGQPRNPVTVYGAVTVVSLRDNMNPDKNGREKTYFTERFESVAFMAVRPETLPAIDGKDINPVILNTTLRALAAADREKMLPQTSPQAREDAISRWSKAPALTA
jgi:hypothetical protein